jgi:hypothetical protein
MKTGRPRKSAPWKPGEPVKAAGCGPERRLAVRETKLPGNTLRLTPTGWAQDLLGTWRRRRKKSSIETVIDDRQYIAGRTIEHLVDAVAGIGKLRAIDLSVPVVDTSFTHRLGGDPDARVAGEHLFALREHLGRRDCEFVMNVLFGMGIHGAMLHEAGMQWRLGDDIGEGARQLAAGILAGGGQYKINPDFSDASAGRSGSFEVQDRQSLEATGRAGAILRKHKLPNENGFAVDDDMENQKTVKRAARTVVSDSKADIELEAQRDELDDIRGLNDPKSRARRDELESTGDLVEIFGIAARAHNSKRQPDAIDVDPDTEAMREMHRTNPPPNRAGHGKERFPPENSIGGTDSFEAILFADRTTRQRAIDAFGMHAVELASMRFRALLSKAADFFETCAPSFDSTMETTHAPATAQIAHRPDIPFKVENVEYETVTIR